MEYFTEENFKVFDESTRLHEHAHQLEKECKELFEKAHRGEILWKDTDCKFKEYLDAANKWKKFFNENINVLSAKVRG